MESNQLVGKIFEEKELYELLLFDIEENFDEYSSKSMHFYFVRLPNDKIKVTEVIYFKNADEMDITSRRLIEKKEWFEIYENENHFNLLLYRLDRSGFVSIIYRDSVKTQDWSHGWADERPSSGPMTQDEIRLAFAELSGFFENEQKKPDLGSKKAA